MLKCTNCGQENREGLLFCDDCGFSLTNIVSGHASATRVMVAETSEESIAKATWGAARFEQGASIVLHVKDANEPMNITPIGRMILGRSDANSSSKPDIDFAAYGAVEKGISRQHAAIELSGEETLMLLDVGSSNGTYLNGQRLLPNQPRVLRDGDEVRLGKLVTHIYFK